MHEKQGRRFKPTPLDRTDFDRRRFSSVSAQASRRAALMIGELIMRIKFPESTGLSPLQKIKTVR